MSDCHLCGCELSAARAFYCEPCLLQIVRLRRGKADAPLPQPIEHGAPVLTAGGGLLTVEEYAAMFAAQGGRCAICRGEPGRKPLAIDHCHATHGVRALLCTACNLALGLMRDNPERLRAAADYVEGHSRRLRASPIMLKRQTRDFSPRISQIAKRIKAMSEEMAVIHSRQNGTAKQA